jgi:concentrative nucleoside transporter, CNT family
MQSFQSALGVVAIVAIAFIVSENHRAVPWRSVIIGLILTFALALLMLKIPQAEIVFGCINRAVEAVAAATKAGTAFVFGYVGGGALPFDPKTQGSDFILAFQARPGCRPQPTSLSARSRRRCLSGPISPSCRAAKCSS